jgi:hypothetical protein
MFTGLIVLICLVAFLRPYLINPNLWFAIAIGGFALCITGFVYNMLNNNPVFRFD